ncbi:hypothetical protein FHW69_000598 [Luteibacter sp. Sphag1AF]|nr:hypothetical protein [Luteibacter sp. Sphag1AF]
MLHVRLRTMDALRNDGQREKLRKTGEPPESYTGHMRCGPGVDATHARPTTFMPSDELFKPVREPTSSFRSIQLFIQQA